MTITAITRRPHYSNYTRAQSIDVFLGHVVGEGSRHVGTSGNACVISVGISAHVQKLILREGTEA